jgi:hypothetical protein
MQGFIHPNEARPSDRWFKAAWLRLTHPLNSAERKKLSDNLAFRFGFAGNSLQKVGA